MEMWLSGRKRLTANEVGSLNTLMGSNPIISAIARLFQFTRAGV